MNRNQVFEETFEAYSSRIRGHLYNNIVNQDEADQIFQDIFFDFWKALINFEEKSKPSTFLYTIMKRRIVDYLRKKYKWTKSLIPKNPELDLDKKSFYMQHLKDLDPVKILLALETDPEKRDLLLAIKKTRKRGGL